MICQNCEDSGLENDSQIPCIARCKISMDIRHERDKEAMLMHYYEFHRLKKKIKNYEEVKS